jgi:hypothetical protein
MPSSPECDNIVYKCRTRNGLLGPLYKYRNDTGLLGQIGPATFLPYGDFFKQVVESKLAQPPQWYFNYPKVYAVGDIHGDFLVLLSVLIMLKAVDQRGNWTGGHALLIFCGDLIDRSGRGPSSRDSSHNNREEVDILQYIYFLNEQAKQVGGRVIAVMGNHEIARIWWKNYGNYNKYVGNQAAGWGGTKNMQRKFKPSHSVAKYLSLMSPLIVQNGNFLFMHGSIPPTHRAKMRNMDSKTYINAWNELLFTSAYSGNELKPPKEIRDLSWSRVYSKPNQDTSADMLCALNKPQQGFTLGIDPKVGGIVLGHTGQSSIRPFCEFFMWRIDLQMSEAFEKKGRPLGGIIIYQKPDKTRIDVYENYPTGEFALTQYLREAGLETQMQQRIIDIRGQGKE